MTEMHPSTTDTHVDDLAHCIDGDCSCDKQIVQLHSKRDVVDTITIERRHDPGYNDPETGEWIDCPMWVIDASCVVDNDKNHVVGSTVTMTQQAPEQMLRQAYIDALHGLFSFVDTYREAVTAREGKK